MRKTRPKNNTPRVPPRQTYHVNSRQVQPSHLKAVLEEHPNELVSHNHRRILIKPKSRTTVPSNQEKNRNLFGTKTTRPTTPRIGRNQRRSLNQHRLISMTTRVQNLSHGQPRCPVLVDTKQFSNPTVDLRRNQGPQGRRSYRPRRWKRCHHTSLLASVIRRKRCSFSLSRRSVRSDLISPQ